MKGNTSNCSSSSVGSDIDDARSVLQSHETVAARGRDDGFT
jgi:hypothetical protein